MDQNNPIISLIAAIAENGVIGKNNKLPWDIPEDLKWFRENTKDKPVIMGRNTYESIIGYRGSSLPNRLNILLTNQRDYQPEGEALVCHDLTSAISAAYEHLKANKSDISEIFIIGGEGVYREAIKSGVVNRMYLTEVKATPEGDTFFPDYPRNEWVETFKEVHEETTQRPAFTFHILERKDQPEHNPA